MSVVGFPGQGIQKPGMAASLKETSGWEYFTKASEVLGYDLGELCLNGPSEQLNRTVYAQPAIFVTCFALWEEVKESLQPELFLGHSLGEVTALAAAGAFSFTDGVRLVAKRGQIMEEAVVEPSGMSAIIGLTLEQIEEICQQVANDVWVEVANINSPRQVVISGFQKGLEEAGELAKELGAKRVIPLRVAGPFHSQLMKPAADKFKQFLAEVQIQDIQVPLVSNYLNRTIASAVEINAELVNQLNNPVRFVDNINLIADMGIQSLVEVSPTAVLGPMVKRIKRGMEIKLATLEGM